MTITQVSDVCYMVAGFMFTVGEVMEQTNGEGGQELFRYPVWVAAPEAYEIEQAAMSFVNDITIVDDLDLYDCPF